LTTPQGAQASDTYFSLIETAKANKLEPSAYIHHVLERIAEAVTVEKLEALLSWNAELPASKSGSVPLRQMGRFNGVYGLLLYCKHFVRSRLRYDCLRVSGLFNDAVL